MKEKKKISGQKAVVCPPIGKATGIKSWPEDDRPREKLRNALSSIPIPFEGLLVERKSPPLELE